MFLDSNNNLIWLRMLGTKDGVTSPVLLQDREAGTQNFSFRYFKFEISSVYENDDNLQFSRLQFYSDDGSVFEYGSDKSVSYVDDEGYTTIEPYGNEGFENALISQNVQNNKKLCGSIEKYPICLIADLKTPRLNVKKYNHWRFYNSWDTRSRLRIAVKFKLYVSLDGTEWLLADEEGMKRETYTTTDNYALQYTGNIKLNV